MAYRQNGLPQKATELGQFFTPSHVVDRMLNLRRNRGTVLEPSCGEGAFLRKLDPATVGVEIDPGLSTDGRVNVGDFFAYSTTRKFDTIIGNPPYVKYRDISSGTKELLNHKLFDRRTNLYLFFIEKCIQHLQDGGELIFITPRDFLKATASSKLNEELYAQGTITDFYELGDTRVFRNALPNCAVWRWEKGLIDDRRVNPRGWFQCINGQICFDTTEYAHEKVGSFFDVKVGAVSGADDIFANEARGCTDMVCSATRTDGKLRRMIYNREDSSLLPFKERLISRRIRKFNETNWWQWGRKFCKRSGPRIYVNSKTRQPRPFFLSEHVAYDGSVLALFPKSDFDLPAAVERLNDLDWKQRGFVCDGRLLFTQRSLENTPFEL